MRSTVSSRADGRMKMQDRILSMLGIAQKAGKVVSGGFQCEKAIQGRQARLVILACDAQKNTSETIRNKCAYYGIPLIQYSNKDALGRAIGKEERACAAVTDEGLGLNIKKLYDSGKKEE